jgi:proteasome lid subunit RPN8/RPN11
MNILDKRLSAVILSATEQCVHFEEEEGGIIISKDNEYVFAKIKNTYARTPIAYGLYETDQLELKEKVIDRMTEGWRMYASFHTHPSFPATPSNLDRSKLFQGFRYNIIFSHRDKMLSLSTWTGSQLTTVYAPLTTITTFSQRNEY